MALIVGEKIIVMMIIAFIGFIAWKAKLVNSVGEKCMTDVLMKVVGPCMVFTSFQKEFDSNLLHNFYIAFAASFVSYIIYVIVSQLIVSNKVKDFGVERLSLVYSNAGFFGIPLVNAMYGSEGVFYLAAYIVVFNIFCWTHGVLVMTNNFNPKVMAKNLCTPAIFAIIIGFTLFVNRIILPEVILEPLKYVGDMNTPLAMMIAGMTLAHTNIVEGLKNKRMYLILALRLFVIAAIIGVILYFVKLPDPIGPIILTVAACPVAVTAVSFSILYKEDGDAGYAAQLVALSTIFCAASLPLVMLIAEKIGIIG